MNLLCKSPDPEVKELVTGILWNLSSCEVIINLNIKAFFKESELHNQKTHIAYMLYFLMCFRRRERNSVKIMGYN